MEEKKSVNYIVYLAVIVAVAVVYVLIKMITSTENVQSERICVDIKPITGMTAGQLVDYQTELEKSRTKMTNYVKTVKSKKDKQLVTQRSWSINFNYIADAGF